MKMKEFVLNRASNVNDIIPLYTGGELCAPSHCYGPHVRGHYLIHYCTSGRGTLYDKHGTHEISAGELFIIRPGEVTTYVADSTDPWRYVWIAFKGESASLFDTDRSVYPCHDAPFLRIEELVESLELSPYPYIAAIYEIIYRLFSEEERTDTLSRIKKYIRYNYMLEISAESVARDFGYERTYLYRIFKARYGTGVKDYIIRVRMENAKSVLTGGHSVKETAALCGYGDEFGFSRAYKKYYGISPSKTRRRDSMSESVT